MSNAPQMVTPLSSSQKCFMGMGKYLVLCLEPFVYYPKKDCPSCKEGGPTYGAHGFWPRLFVPFGWIYEDFGDGHVEIIGPAEFESHGRRFTLAAPKEAMGVWDGA